MVIPPRLILAGARMSVRSLSELTVSILGLGQIGSSLGAALIRRKLVHHVVGAARRPEICRRAIEIGAAHEAAEDLLAAAAKGDIVILATPVRHIVKIIPDLARAMKPGALLLDAGSTKEEILKAALKAKPAISVIGGHPMAGTEKAGIEACDPQLFVGHPFILIPARLADPRMADWAVALAKGIGSYLVWLDRGSDHDCGVATISHLPYLIAYALMHAAKEVSEKRFEGDNSQGPFVLSLAGPSFRGATRVARSDVNMVVDFLLTNRKELPRIVDAFSRQLKHAAGLVRKGDEAGLREFLESAKKLRDGMEGAGEG